LHLQKGEKDKAKELVGKVKEKLGKPDSDTDKLVYLESATQDLLREIDPAAAAAASSFSPDQLNALQQGAQDPGKLGELLKQMGVDMKAKTDAPAAPTPAPAAPDQSSEDTAAPATNVPVPPTDTARAQKPSGAVPPARPVPPTPRGAPNPATPTPQGIPTPSE
jgi:hypothetical protein